MKRLNVEQWMPMISKQINYEIDRIGKVNHGPVRRRNTEQFLFWYLSVCDNKQNVVDLCMQPNVLLASECNFPMNLMCHNYMKLSPVGHFIFRCHYKYSREENTKTPSALFAVNSHRVLYLCYSRKTASSRIWRDRMANNLLKMAEVAIKPHSCVYLYAHQAFILLVVRWSSANNIKHCV